MEALSYRPRNAGHDYYGRGTYLITLVVSGRERLLSHFATENGRKGEADSKGESGRKGEATLALTPLGEVVQEAWLQTPSVHRLMATRWWFMREYVCLTISTVLSKYWKPCSGVWAISFRPSRLLVPVGGSRGRDFRLLQSADIGRL